MYAEVAKDCWSCQPVPAIAPLLPRYFWSWPVTSKFLIQLRFEAYLRNVHGITLLADKIGSVALWLPNFCSHVIQPWRKICSISETKRALRSYYRTTIFWNMDSYEQDSYGLREVQLYLKIYKQNVDVSCEGPWSGS